MFRFLIALVLLLNRAAPMDCDWTMTQGWQAAKRVNGKGESAQGSGTVDGPAVAHTAFATSHGWPISTDSTC